MPLIPAVPRSNSSIIITNDNNDQQQQHQQQQQNIIVSINDDYYPTSYDILLGKEKAVFNHSGNKRFRAIINSQIKAYIDAPTKSAKTKLIHQIHIDIRKSGHRFLKKRDDSEESNLWDEVDRHGAREKVSHALRDRVKGLVKSTRKRHERGEILAATTVVSNSAIRKILREELGSSKSQEQKKGAGAMSVLFQMNIPENRLFPRPVTYDNSTTSLHDSNKNKDLSLSIKNSKKRRLSLLDTFAATANLIDNQNNFSAAGIFSESLLSPSRADPSRDKKKRRLSLLGISNMFVPLKASRRNGLKLGGGREVEQRLMGNNGSSNISSRMLSPNNNKKTTCTAPKRRLSLLCLQQRNLIDNFNDDNKSYDKFESKVSHFSTEETIRRFSLLQNNNSSDDNNDMDNEIIAWNLSQRSRRRLSMLGFLEEEEQKHPYEKEESDHSDSLDSFTKSNSSSWRPVSMFGFFQTDDTSASTNRINCDDIDVADDDDDNDNNDNDNDDENKNNFSTIKPKERIEVIFGQRQKQSNRFRRRRSSMSTLFFGDDHNIETNNHHESFDSSIELNDAYLDDLFSCGGGGDKQQ